MPKSLWIQIIETLIIQLKPVNVITFGKLLSDPHNQNATLSNQPDSLTVKMPDSLWKQLKHEYTVEAG